MHLTDISKSLKSKKMKIAVVGMVKNEADIIESFVRYTLTFADEMILYDDGSRDNTPHILYHLSEEFKGRIIIEKRKDDFSEGRKQDIITKSLLDEAYEKSKPDWLIPLDADEFLISRSGKPLRKIFEEMDRSCCHFVKWRQFICMPGEGLATDEKAFIPSKFKKYHLDELKNLAKVVIPSALYDIEQAIIAIGNHDLFRIDGVSIPKKESEDMILAHYQVRGRNQIMRKALCGWTSTLLMPQRGENQGYHQKITYDLIKEKNVLSDEDVAWHGLVGYKEKRPKGLPKCGTIDIKKHYPEIECIFESKSDPYMKVFLEYMEDIFREVKIVKEELKKTKKEEIELRNILNETKMSHKKVQKTVLKQKNELDSIKASRGWKTVCGIRILKKKFKI